MTELSVAAVPDDIVRVAEWERVHAFAVAHRPDPGGLAIAGEAGAGKSTLWRAGAEAAAGAGHRVLRSEPAPGETDLAFAGLFDLFADLLPEVGGEIPEPQRAALEVAL